MATSTSYAFNPQTDDIVRDACQIAGIVTAGGTPTNGQLLLGRQQLNYFIKALQAEGTILSTVERTTKTLTAGTAEYPLDADTIDVEGDGTIVPSGGTGETQVRQISLSEYMARTDKSTTTTGIPNQFYVEKHATVKIVLCPTPSSDAPTFRYARVRLLKDNDTGGVTTDLPSRWLHAVVLGTAHLIALASSMPIMSIAYLGKQAGAAKAEARKSEGRRPPTQFVVRHRGRTF